MKINQVLVEAAGATVAFAFGRFNPAHQGHVEVWRAVENAGANWFIGTNPNTLGPNDPLTFEQKSAWMEEIYPPIQGHIVPEQSVLTLAAYIFKKLRKNERATVAYITDATDWAWSGKLLNQYNGVEGSHGYYKFAQIIHEPSPRVSSATALRDAARADDRVAFYHASGTDPNAKVNGLTYFDTVKQAVEKYPLPVKRGQKVKQQGVAEADINRRGILKGIGAAALGAAGVSAMAKGGGGGGRGGGGGGRASSGGRTTVGRGPQSASHVSNEPHSTFRSGAPFVPHGTAGSPRGDGSIANDADKAEYVKFLSSYADAIRAGKMTPEMRKWLNAHPDVIADLKRGKYGLTMGQLNADLVDLGQRKNPHMMRKEGIAEDEQKTVAKTWDQMTPQEKISGVKGRTVWNEKTKKYYTVFDVPAKQETDEASLSTMRDYFAGDEDARDPYEITKQRLHFSKEKDASQATHRKEFRSQWEYEQWLKQNKLKSISGVKEDEEAGEVKKTKQLIPFPAGTTKVAVSDVYDWYKLGQVISDLDDADPNTFGQGAPQSIIAFGSEEEEHKLLPLLKRLGLKLQDVDQPVSEAIAASSLYEMLNKRKHRGY